jgi:lipopolysaccharide transport system permease protein
VKVKTDAIKPLVIEAGRARLGYWSDLWLHRELLWFLAWRDLVVRYRQAVIGIAWAVIRPALTVAVFSILFGRLAGLPSGSVPYPLMVLAGLLAWQFFVTAVTSASACLVGNANLITKVYFPRLILPMSTALVALVDLLISLVLYALLAAWYGHPPGWTVLALPVFFVLLVVIALGISVWLAALNARYRDFQHAVPFLLQLGLYVSPVAFSSSIVPGKWRLLYYLNPMAGVIDGFRWSLLQGADLPYWPGVWLAAAVSCVLAFSGMTYFRSTERLLADFI